jgi:dTMP kinase
MISNKLIVLEGIDGVGKTTLAHALVEELKSKGIDAVCYEDVEDAFSVFNQTKQKVKESAVIEAQFYFYLASAIQKSSHIQDLLNKQWVICDRYVYSTYAYHIVKGMSAMHMPTIETLPILTPDLALLLVLDEQTRQERVRQRVDNDVYDYELKTPESVLGRFETELKKFGLKELDTNDSLLNIAHGILNDLFKIDE